MLIATIAVAIIEVDKISTSHQRGILDALHISPEAERGKPHVPELPLNEAGPRLMSAEESKAELERLQKLIESRKKIAWDTDISHHLWGLYKGHLQSTSQYSLSRSIQIGEWYDVKILTVKNQSGLRKCEFELKGARYKFVDDEEKQGWREHTKFFSLFLYDDSDRCLIEIPMKMKVDSEGRSYSILSNGPNAFLPGGWVNDFINVKLKHQSIRNQEIRAQRHRERLSEIEDLKGRFGILD